VAQRSVAVGDGPQLRTFEDLPYVARPDCRPPPSLGVTVSRRGNTDHRVSIAKRVVPAVALAPGASYLSAIALNSVQGRT
jgi:hypothetical protein